MIWKNDNIFTSGTLFWGRAEAKDKEFNSVSWFFAERENERMIPPKMDAHFFPSPKGKITLRFMEFGFCRKSHHFLGKAENIRCMTAFVGWKGYDLLVERQLSNQNLKSWLQVPHCNAAELNSAAASQSLSVVTYNVWFSHLAIFWKKILHWEMEYMLHPILVVGKRMSTCGHGG